MTIKETITLFKREGASDKFYTLTLEEETCFCRVTYANGRRGSSGQTGIKCPPSAYDEAKKIYDKTLKAKRKDGYHEDENGIAYAGIGDKIDTGRRPHLLKAKNEDQIELFLKDPRYGAQEKYDGHRKMLDKTPERIISINRKGQQVGYPAILEDAARELQATHFCIDGEEIGGMFYAYDILSTETQDLRKMPYITRWDFLRSVIKGNSHIVIAPLYVTEIEKRELYDQLVAEKKEGMVFKKLDSLYQETMKNDDQVKFKFYEEASFIVIKVNKQRSIEVGIYDGEHLISVGNCTIPVNKEIPAPAAIVDIKYLYAYRGGAIYQPTYLKERTDIEPTECNISQLKYKAENEEDSD